MKAFRLLRYLAVACLALLFVACDKDEPATTSTLASSVWEGELIKRNDRGENVIEGNIHFFFKEDGKCDLVVSTDDNRLVGKYENADYVLKGKVFNMKFHGLNYPRAIFYESWFVARLTNQEFLLELDGGYRKMHLWRKR